jgi:hypothetical protein
MSGLMAPYEYGLASVTIGNDLFGPYNVSAYSGANFTIDGAPLPNDAYLVVYEELSPGNNQIFCTSDFYIPT